MGQINAPGDGDKVRLWSFTTGLRQHSAIAMREIGVAREWENGVADIEREEQGAREPTRSRTFRKSSSNVTMTLQVLSAVTFLEFQIAAAPASFIAA